MLKDYSPDESSLGKRVYDLINSDLSQVVNMLVSEKEDTSIKKQLINASSIYIVMLESIQKQILSE